MSAPRLLELCFQTAGLWEAGRHSRLALPQHVHRARVVGNPENAAEPLSAHAIPRADGGFDALVTDANGAVLLMLDGYDTVPLPGALAPDIAEALSATFT